MRRSLHLKTTGDGDRSRSPLQPPARSCWSAGQPKTDAQVGTCLSLPQQALGGTRAGVAGPLARCWTLGQSGANRAPSVSSTKPSPGAPPPRHEGCPSHSSRVAEQGTGKRVKQGRSQAHALRVRAPESPAGDFVQGTPWARHQRPQLFQSAHTSHPLPPNPRP